jgi:hypothetical protein
MHPRTQIIYRAPGDSQSQIGAIAATRDHLDGYWLNIPQPGEQCPRGNDFRPDMAIEVLRRLAVP